MSAPATRPRDPRLDFFRGLAMFIIVIAHTPWNPWTLWIPARFGFSDATEIFVFCSGMASAIAFGGTFARLGPWVGAARTGYRVWQIYWAHIGAFLVVAALMVALDASGRFERNYVDALNLGSFLREPGPGLVALLTLGYVPNYFDILPMYMVVLALMPLVLGLASLHRGLAAAGVLGLWFAANLGILNLPAAPWSDRKWFFDPFGWQLLFFLGFAFSAGWVRPPPVRRDLLWLAAGIVIVAIPFAHYALRPVVPGAAEAWSAVAPLAGKTPFGPLRLLHFLAIAYLAWVAVGPAGARLSEGTWRPRIVGIVRLVGQQSLAVFVSGLVLAQLLGVALDVLGRGWFATLGVNLFGMALVVGLASGAAWFRTPPWELRADRAPLEPAQGKGEASQPKLKVVSGKR